MTFMKLVRLMKHLKNFGWSKRERRIFWFGMNFYKDFIGGKNREVK